MLLANKVGFSCVTFLLLLFNQLCLSFSSCHGHISRLLTFNLTFPREHESAAGAEQKQSVCGFIRTASTYLSLRISFFVLTRAELSLGSYVSRSCLVEWQKKRNWMNDILALLVSPFNFFYTILNPFQPSSEIKLNFIYIASIFHKLTLLLNTDKAPYLRHREPV